ncbi:hypothetical protein JXA02_08300 [candidate division KSB1 bacterium]|nr:hypothetical protein [candidate division KSB1 bacterium]RQW05457.1 MAG: hypothetical protein EH222_09800 [candidate division KSB1 bacterium]
MKRMPLWHWLSERSFLVRLIIKTVLFICIFLVVTFPNPVLNIKQVQAYLNTETLFDTNFELDVINAEIDSLLPANHTTLDEYKAVVQFVYQHIPYQFDWDNWGNSEYWPSASETWRRGREDCDGRAILAVAIFRSRGYKDANIVGSMKHLWIKVGDQELMGPDRETIMVMDQGQKKMRMPPFIYMVEAMALQLSYYPIFRMLLITLIALILLYHPATDVQRLLGLAVVAIIGFVLIVDWADAVAFYEEMKLTVGLAAGGLLLLMAFILALWPGRPLRK